tara:strand:+ start:9238 stop:9591 length:354 start_codon:yes stop_codon:yes gene_type:complete
MKDTDIEKRLRGRKCTGKCTIHGEQCGVVLRYKDKKIQSTLERLQTLAGGPMHTKNSPLHYCELCSRALRENRPMNAYARRKNGIVYLKHAGGSRFADENKDGTLVMVDDEKYEEEE